MIKAIIFDMDGVIIDSEDVNLKASIKAFKEKNIKLTKEDLDYIKGRHPIDSNKHLLKKYKFNNKEMIKRQQELYFEHYSHMKPYKRTVEFIKEIKKHYPVALATSSEPRAVEIMMKRCKLKNTFKVVSTFFDVEKHKPHPQMYLLTAKKLNIHPKHCLVFEDTALGVEAATRAGMTCIALPNKYTKNQDFSKASLILSHRQKLNLDKITKKITT